MSREDHGASAEPVRPPHHVEARNGRQPDDTLRPHDLEDDVTDADPSGDRGESDEPAPFNAAHADFHERTDEQTDFREQFDEDLYTDREDHPAQGNTADIAMEHRFGSEADAYAEHAWRRPGDHHEGDGAAVGQSRDPADTKADSNSDENR